MEQILKIIIFILLILVAPANSKSPPPGTGTSDTPANIMIMLDNSGSMAWSTDANAIGTVQSPIDVATDSSGNIYVLQFNPYCNIQVFNSSGTYLRQIGAGCYDSSTSIWLDFPYQLAIYGNEIYVAHNRGVKVFDLNGNYLRSSDQSRAATAVAVTSNYIYTSPYGASTAIYQFNRSTATYKKLYYLEPYITATNCPTVTGLQANKSETKLLVSCGDNNGTGRTILVYNLINGAIDINTAPYTFSQGSYSNTAPGTFKAPWDAVFDSSDNIYAVDTGNKRVQKFNSSYVYQSTIGSYSTTSSFCEPRGIGIDSSNNIYVADYCQNKIYKLGTTLSSATVVAGISRMDIAKSVIKKIVSNSDLTSGANFGLMEWGFPYAWSSGSGGQRIRVPISSTGAKTIYTDVDSVVPGGGTYLNEALNLAKSYFAGSAGYPSPIVSGASCQLNYLIVISDGEWDNPSGANTNASSLANQSPSIKTFAVGLALGGSSANYSNLATAGQTTTPLYASNEAELLAALTSAINQIISSTLTFSTPAITNDITLGDYTYQSTFSYAKNKQWEGSLKKYQLNSNGTIGSLQWDAGTLLNNKSASSRNLWTTGISGTGINNFTTTYRSELKNLFSSSLVSSDTQVDNLINFVRGIDTYDQNADSSTTDSRWKLNDIYHSQISIVGPPSSLVSYDNIYQDGYYRTVNNYSNFVNSNVCGSSCANREEIVLAGSNAGILHAFKSSTGEELWGFIPPSMLNKLPNIISSTVNVTNSIYGVDGSPVVKDIYYNGSWRTIALTGLGRGGNSYFALDITNPYSPSHLFTIENDATVGVVNFWNSSGAKTTYLYSFGSVSDSTKDYSKLGESWSTPRIFRMKISGTDKWVAAFGAGYNGGVNTNLGSAVFVMDLENGGNLLKKIDITDKSNGIANSVPSDIIAVTANGTTKAQYYGAMLYVPDYEGKITKINLTSSGTLYGSTQLFDAETTTTNGRYILTGAETTIGADNNLWLYFGTGDTQKLQDQISGTDQNRLYGIKDANFPNFVSLSSNGTVLNCKNTTTQSSCPTSSDLGWYVNLINSQKLTAQPTIKNTSVYFPIYEPTIGVNICNSGKAILKATGTSCGDSLLSATLGTGVLSKVSTIGSKVVVGLSGVADTSAATGFSKKDNLITGDQVGTTSQSTITIEAWREN
jgi:type IV pilus assembly protein PilY1